MNKVETRVELLFDIVNSPSLSDHQKEMLCEALGTRVNADGILHISSQKSRSQWENKQLVIEKLVSVIRGALRVKKKRVKTAPTHASKERRVQSKKKHGQKKKMRKVSPDSE